MKLSDVAIAIGLTIAAITAAVVASEQGDRTRATNDFVAVADSDEATEPEDPKLREAFDLINASIDLYGWDERNPVALVRAVNYLKRLGKHRAIETLRAYVRYAPVHGRPFERHSPNQQRLCWIIPLLFVPENEGGKLPSLGRDPSRKSRGSWEAFDISVEKELPFHDVALQGRFGSPDPERGYLVEWANEHGQLREEPIRPTDDPLKAADELCERLAKSDKKGFRREDTIHIRLQARRAIEHLLPLDDKQNKWWVDRGWQKLQDEVKKLDIRWDVKEQNYVVGPFSHPAP